MGSSEGSTVGCSEGLLGLLDGVQVGALDGNVGLSVGEPIAGSAKDGCMNIIIKNKKFCGRTLVNICHIKSVECVL